MIIVDLVLNIDGLIVEDEKHIEEYVKNVEKITNSNYPIKFEISYSEKI